MSIRKRKIKGGETAEYHYEFMQNGKRYYGVCEGCTTKPAALAYERSLKDTAKELAGQKSVGALVENFKRELVGGADITLTNAFMLYESKPAKRHCSEKQMASKRSYWSDFCAYLRATIPDLDNLDKVTRPHAEGYISHLKTHGRFIKEVKNGSRSAYAALNALSNSTINVYHKTMRSVFAKLKEDAGLLFNPFDFDMLENESSNRDAFSIGELHLIGKNLTPFVRPIFIIGICTGMSEGDICLLRWNDIRGNWICRKRKKTKVNLDIPILPPLQALLKEQYPISGNGEFVLPEHSAMYQSNPSGISYRFKQFLENLDIRTTRITEGRSRSSSVKDVHSLRHTFAYMAGCHQVPLPVVQSVLGHMSPEMTKHYQAHADREAKEKYLTQLPDFLGTVQVMRLPSSATCQEELSDLLQLLPPEKQQQVLTFAKSLL